MKLLAISGGPDSMFLLEKYKNKKIIVAHVNYNKRSDSHIDEKIVQNFCQKHNIPFKKLSLNKKPIGNFQSWAREERYNFFKSIYLEFNCKELIMAHHKDDFIETAIMQQESGRTPRYFGIKERNVIKGMKIYRPFLHLYWKTEIIKYLKNKNIKFAIDSSNLQPLFKRNKVRIRLLNKTIIEKESIYKWFKMSNKILKKKFGKVDFLYKKWLKRNFDINFFRNINYQTELVYEYINNNFEGINLSKGKIESLVNYINSENGGKKFILNNEISLIKKHGKIKKHE